MKTFDITRTQYKVSDFLSWQKAGTLTLSPSFQRRSVWKKGAKSYLVDTVVRGLPIPIIFLRERRTDLKTFEPMREVVDGQQRIRTLISYISPNLLKDYNENRDLFTILSSHNKELAGLTFEKLSEDLKSRILDYKFSVHVLPPDVDDQEVLQIFSRINSTGTKLNYQELRNAEYFGEFKTLMYNLALKNLNRWREWKIFTEDNISRMLEVELASELLIFMLKGLLAKKQKFINQTYKKYDETFQEKNELEKRFDIVMEVIDENLGNNLQFSAYKNKTLFFGLFGIVYEMLYGKKTILEKKQPQKIPNDKWTILMAESDKFDKKKVPRNVVEAITRRTTDLSSRKILLEHLRKIING
ncbi:MAG TPA: DUF262 domain-containing protein [Candidatus Wunengus sp. YC60]|uniref:DUF262 domain-containing protein n=1 Tax=Candidatus Wunengus sp. YC60 TaxID=3367697 RepID=UPI004025BA03